MNARCATWLLPLRRNAAACNSSFIDPARDPATITAFDRWSSEEDHARHLQGDHVKTLITRFDGMLAAPPEIVTMKPVSNE